MEAIILYVGLYFCWFISGQIIQWFHISMIVAINNTDSVGSCLICDIKKVEGKEYGISMFVVL